MSQHIFTRPATNEYREGWERIYGAKAQTERTIDALIDALNTGKPLPPGTHKLSLEPGTDKLEILESGAEPWTYGDPQPKAGS